MTSYAFLSLPIAVCASVGAVNANLCARLHEKSDLFSAANASRMIFALIAPEWRNTELAKQGVCWRYIMVPLPSLITNLARTKTFTEHTAIKSALYTLTVLFIW